MTLSLLGLYSDQPLLSSLKAKRQLPARKALYFSAKCQQISYRLKQSVSVVVPDMWLSPFTTLPSLPGLRGQNGVEEPGRSKLMSQKGSIVVETPLEAKGDKRHA